MSEGAKKTGKAVVAGAATYGGWKIGGKVLWPLLKLLKLAKLAKVAGSVGSMALSIFTYSLIYGWRYATGFVLLLLTHELGHYVVARRAGLNVGLPAFIPFVGAWIQLKENFPNVETEARIALAGPLVGSTAALAVFVVWQLTDIEVLLAIAYSGFFLNLFNLIPLTPLDGGRITAVISPWLWLLGIPVLIGVFFYHPSGLLIVLAIVAIPQLFRAFKNRNDPEQQTYLSAPLASRIGYAILYLGLAGLLAVLSQRSYDLLEVMRHG
jgi:Zn-dependent protease